MPANYSIKKKKKKQKKQQNKSLIQPCYFSLAWKGCHVPPSAASAKIGSCTNAGLCADRGERLIESRRNREQAHRTWICQNSVLIKSVFWCEYSVDLLCLLLRYFFSAFCLFGVLGDFLCGVFWLAGLFWVFLFAPLYPSPGPHPFVWKEKSCKGFNSH